MTLYQKLQEYSESDYYGFHMPGHKRNGRLLGNGLPYEIDITEIEGFDDLHHASGILKEAQEQAALLYGAEETRFLINGSTVGILSGILGNTRKGDGVLVSRNCHKSVYHAIFMNELTPWYLYPEFDEQLQLNTGISVSAVQTALNEHSEIRAVVIVSPTYDGVVSDVEAIAKIVHERGIPLIVDEAHGAHLGFHPYFPENANARGADVVIHSIHKTLPALTQTALIHMNGSIGDRAEVKTYLDMLQSSSPSYVLMAGIEVCMDMLGSRREEVFGAYEKNLRTCREALKKLQCLKLIETEHFDPSKILISVKNADITSRELYERLLHTYHLQMEMVAGTYVLGMTSVADTEEGFERLKEALTEIDTEISKRQSVDSSACKIENMAAPLPVTTRIYTSARIAQMVKSPEGEQQVKALPWREAVGYISTEYAYIYPPGSPLIVPGEQMTEEVADALEKYEKLDFKIEGLKKEKYIEVWING